MLFIKAVLQKVCLGLSSLHQGTEWEEVSTAVCRSYVQPLVRCACTQAQFKTAQLVFVTKRNIVKRKYCDFLMATALLHYVKHGKYFQM